MIKVLKLKSEVKDPDYRWKMGLQHVAAVLFSLHLHTNQGPFSPTLPFLIVPTAQKHGMKLSRPKG